MSQQNKETKEVIENINGEEVVKKRIISGKIVIGFIIFTIICVSATAFAIWYKNSKTEDVLVTEEREELALNQSIERMKIKSLLERYKENDLEAIESVEYIGPARQLSYETDKKTTKITITYYTIKGLKDTTIESSINTQINDEVRSWYTEEELNNPDIDYIEIYGHLMGNFANVVSMNFDKSIKYKGDKWDHEAKTLNIDLSTGEKIEFEDLFLPGTSIKTIVSQAIYDNLVGTYTSQDTNGDGVPDKYEEDLSKVDMSDIEDKVFMTMSKYSKIPSNKFSFSNSYIGFELDGKWYVFDLWKYYDKIAIYHRYETENSIFDGTHKKEGDNLVFQGINPYINNVQVLDNFITISYKLGDVSKKGENYIRKYNEHIEKKDREMLKLEEEANNNSTQTILYLYRIYLNEIDDFWNYNDWNGYGSVQHRTDLLNNYEICEIRKDERILRLPTSYFKGDFLKRLYEKSETLEETINLGEEYITKILGDSVKVENNDENLKTIDLKSNKQIEDIIDEELKKIIDKIDEYTKREMSDDERNEVERLLSLLNENLIISENKFNYSNNEKINEINEKFKNELNAIREELYILDLKNEIKNTFGTFIEETIANREEEHADEIYNRSNSLNQHLSTYYSKSDNKEYQAMISDYNKKLQEIQEWAISVREKKLEDEKKEEEKKQEELQKQVEKEKENVISNNLINQNTLTNETKNEVEE